MGKHTDALKPYDEFRAPWETEGGDEAEIDKAKLKRFIFNLIGDKAKAQDARDDALESVKTAETERDEAKAEAEKASPDEANKKIARLESENATLKAEAEARKKADEHEELRKEVIGDLDPKYAKYVTGDDREALEKSLEQVKADFSLVDGDEDEDGDENEGRIRTTPRPRLRNPGAGSGDRVDEAVDFDKVAEMALSGGIFR